MSSNLLKIFIFLLLSIHSLCASAKFYVDSGQIMSEVQTYEKNGQKVVLIDMIHIGPKKFYRDLRKELQNYNVKDSIVLSEGVSQCSSIQDFYIVPGENANFKKLEEFYRKREQLTELSLKDIEKIGFQAVYCQKKDVKSNQQNNFIKRQLKRFSIYGIVAGFSFLRSQSTMNLYPKKMEMKNGDVVSSKFLHIATKAIFGSFFKCLLSFKSDGGCQKFSEWYQKNSSKQLYEEAILVTRNNILLKKTFMELGMEVDHRVDYDLLGYREGEHNTVILPWGANHMDKGLIQSLLSLGFVKLKSKGITYISCKRMDRNILLREGLFSKNIKKECDRSLSINSKNIQ